MAQRGKKPKDFPKLNQDQLKTIITKPEGAKELVKVADQIGESLADQRLTTNQIRAIFGEVRRIEGDWKVQPERAYRSLILLKPKMAYRAKKEETRYNKSVRNLVSVLDPAIELVEGKTENFTRFVDFFEAILAYHKAHGGT